MLKKINVRKVLLLSVFFIVVALISGALAIILETVQKYSYSGYESDIDYRVEFGDEGFFYVKESNAHYMDGRVLDLQGLAKDYNQTASKMTENDEGVLIYECVPENGTRIRVHGSRGVDIPYVEGTVYTGHPCTVRVFFYDDKDERTIMLPDGSRISPLAAYVAQFMLDSIWNHPDEFKERFLRLEKWENAACAEVSVR
ncbi:MAG: hypothetical protein K5837_04155 [Candidatus Saccharibacteria bacterium]|nr:hypothetical protein [Candidatus Saccharibacteria bacterium]